MEPVPDYIGEHTNAVIEGVKVGTLKINGDRLAPEIKQSFKGAVSKIERSGGEVIEVKLDISRSIDTHSTILMAEAASQHSEFLARYPDKYGSNVIWRLRKGQEIKANEYIRTLREREVTIRELEMLFREVDFLMLPSVQILPPKIGQETVTIDSTEVDVHSGCTRFTRLANLTGMPAIVVPFGVSSGSLPLSVQFMGPRLSETGLLKLAYTFEKNTPTRTPLL